MTTTNQIIGSRIRAARKSLHMTQEKLAEKMKVSVAYYGRLERGEKAINLERLQEISKLLGVPMSELVEEPKEEKPAETSVSSTVFLEQMIHYSLHCKEATLRRMLAVCAALAAEDGKQ